MKASDMIAWARRKQKKKSSRKKSGKSRGISLINKPTTPTNYGTNYADPDKAKDNRQTMVRGKPSTSTDFVYDRSLFDQEHREGGGVGRGPDTAIKYGRLKDRKINEQKPPLIPGSTEIRHAIDPTTNKSLKGVLKELDHVASLFTVQQLVTPPSNYSTDFVKNKWKVREGGTENLSPEQMAGLYLTEHTQVTSKEVNRAKGAKRLSEYTKAEGWGAGSTYNPVRQAQSYHDSLLEVAKKFGKRGGFSREDAQAYREITGKEPDPLLDGGMGSQFSPPSTRSNITGFDAYGDKRRQKAADLHFGKEKEKEAKMIQGKQMSAEYSGEIPEGLHGKRQQQPIPQIPKGKSAKEVALEKKQAEVTKKAKSRGYEKVGGKWQKIIKTLPAKDQGSSNLKSDPQFSYIQSEPYTGKSKKEVDKARKAQGGGEDDLRGVKRDYEKVDGKWRKTQKTSTINQGISAPSLVKNAQGYWVTPRVIEAGKKRKAKAKRAYEDSESWM